MRILALVFHCFFYDHYDALVFRDCGSENGGILRDHHVHESVNGNVNDAPLSAF